jgi:hypothetical protein
VPRELINVHGVQKLSLDHAGKPIECQAAIAWDSKKPLDVTTVTVDPPGPGEVRVKVVATALCHTVRT